MKKIFVFLVIFIIVFSHIIYSQSLQTDVWYFGHYAGLKFISGNPVALSNSQMNTDEGCSVLSDYSGNLLFYTNGVNVWDKNNNIMPNGTGLSGNVSTTQTLIVRNPNNCLQYYIFYSSGPYTGGALDNKAYYSIVDLTLNGGLGDIVASSKNTFLYYPVTEKLTSVHNQNGTDIWIIFHELNSSNFLSYSITSTGLNTTPVISNAGPSHTNMIGYMKSNHKGDKLAAALSFNGTNRVELYDFNKSTGIVTNPILFNNLNGAYGLEFSPSDSLLYVSAFWGTNNLFQIDLSNNAIQTIATDNSGNYGYGALQLGPNGKIYMIRGQLGYLSVINNPNILGTNCNFINNGFTLASGTNGILGLPTFDQSLFAYNSNYYFSYTQNNCATYNFQTAPSSYDSLLWNFGDPSSGNNNYSYILNPSHSFSNAGSYNVKLIIYNKCYTDTLQRTITSGSDSSDIYIPNVFTPNGDGFNDKFEIKSLDLSNVDLKIYNRWGNLLFKDNDTHVSWDGKYNGVNCSDGVYFWIIQYQTNCNNIINKKYKTGFIHLLR